MAESNGEHQTNRAQASSLSYKFQRLRERLRAAIASGELSGKLPGERVLAQKFEVNPKTLSKALTDLAAEGLLDRSIGRGTFVQGSRPTPAGGEGKWLILTDDGAADSPVVRELVQAHPDSQIANSAGKFRPSFINHFAGVIDCSAATAPSLHRSLIVRGIPCVRVGHEPRVSKTHAVLLDREYAAFSLGRRLLIAGQRRLIAVEKPGVETVSTALREAVRRYEPAAVLEVTTIDRLASILGDQAATIVCDGAEAATAARDILQNINGSIACALTAVGCADHPPCSGYFIEPRVVATAVIDLMRDVQAQRASVLWLIGEFVPSPDAPSRKVSDGNRQQPMAVSA